MQLQSWQFDNILCHLICIKIIKKSCSRFAAFVSKVSRKSRGRGTLLRKHRVWGVQLRGTQFHLGSLFLFVGPKSIYKYVYKCFALGFTKLRHKNVIFITSFVLPQSHHRQMRRLVIKVSRVLYAATRTSIVNSWRWRRYRTISYLLHEVHYRMRMLFASLLQSIPKSFFCFFLGGFQEKVSVSRQKTFGVQTPDE